MVVSPSCEDTVCEVVHIKKVNVGHFNLFTVNKKGNLMGSMKRDICVPYTPGFIQI